MRFLENEIIRLRAVEPDDWKTLYEIENDSSQWRENSMMAPYSKKNLKEYAENYDADPIRSGQLRLIIELKGNKEIAGIVDLYEINPTGRTAFMGIYVLEDKRRNGIASNALLMMEKYARVLLNLRILGAKISGRNMSSAALFVKSGFSKCGSLSGWLKNGKETSSLDIYIKSIETS